MPKELSFRKEKEPLSGLMTDLGLTNRSVANIFERKKQQRLPEDKSIQQKAADTLSRRRLRRTIAPSRLYAGQGRLPFRPRTPSFPPAGGIVSARASP
ncbi:hypothetical protein H6B14_11455 [Phocaeicola coprophilus]|nr:hypothetical protein [Phocaeicola coprophilus]